MIRPVVNSWDCVYSQTNSIAADLNQFLITTLRIDDFEKEHHQLYARLISDRSAKQIPPDILGKALVISIQKNHSRFYPILLNLPNAQDIPSNGQWGLGHVLLETIQKQDIEAFKLIKQHPRFNEIKPDGSEGLDSALLECLKMILQQYSSNFEVAEPPVFKPDFLEAITNHPHAEQLQLGSSFSNLIGKTLLEIIIESPKRLNDDQKYVFFALLNSKISHLIEPNGAYGLGRILITAASLRKLSFTKGLLAHPKARAITSKITIVDYKTEFEFFFKLNRFGIKEALFAAVMSSYSYIQKAQKIQTQIAVAILAFAKQHEISLNAAGPYGIAGSLTSASMDNENLVRVILIYPESKKIPAIASLKSEGLNNALINAAGEGLLNAAKCILKHPNAKQISYEDLHIAIDYAQKLYHPKVAALIQDFLDHEK